MLWLRETGLLALFLVLMVLWAAGLTCGTVLRP